MVRVVPSARRELLETVARLRRSDPELAERFVRAVEARLGDLTDGLDAVPELDSPRHAATATAGHRFYLRERSSGTWLIAVWPDPEARGSD